MIKPSWLIAAALLVSGGPTLAADYRLDPQSGCSVYLADDQTQWQAHWHGACRDGKAQGLGVVRLFENGQFYGAFFGQVAKGQWKNGVFRTPTGDIAGMFQNNHALPTDDRNDLIRAFDIAAQAATALSNEFQRAGNKASAAHYRQVAENLLNTLD